MTDDYRPEQKWLDLFRTEVDDRAAEIDPGDEHDWRSLTLGWALAKGMDPEEADRFSSYVRYETDMA